MSIVETLVAVAILVIGLTGSIQFAGKLVTAENLPIRQELRESLFEVSEKQILEDIKNGILVRSLKNHVKLEYSLDQFQKHTDLKVLTIKAQKAEFVDARTVVLHLPNL